MAEQYVAINFSGGVETKQDPWQLQAGQFLSLINTVFQKGGLLSKRNGYPALTGTPPASTAYLTTLNDNLVGVGETISAYSSSSMTWITKGTLQPCSLAVMPLVRNNLNQIQNDSVTLNGVTCVAYTQSDGTNSTYLFAVEDAVTGQNLAPPTVIPPLTSGTISGSPRVVVVGNYFVIICPVTVASTVFLQYVTISYFNLNVVSAAQNVYPEAYIPLATNPGWDCVVTQSDTLVVAYNTTVGGQGIHITTLTSSQVASNSASSVVFAFTGSTYEAAILSLCVDMTTTAEIVYISFTASLFSNLGVYTGCLNIGFGSITAVFNPVAVYTSTLITNIVSAAQNGSCQVFLEVPHIYIFLVVVPTHYVVQVPITQGGAVGSVTTSVRSVGLASKAFIVNSVVYYLAAFQSPFQPSYFLINGSISTQATPVIVAKLAYQNGGGYLSLGLPSVTVSGNSATVSYLFKDDVQALNTTNTTEQLTTGGIYSQFGVNSCTFTLGTDAIQVSELGKDLHVSGGFLSMFDGFYPVEHNFFLFPDSVQIFWNDTGGAIAAQPDGSTNTNAYYYMVTYEWTDMQGNAFKSAPSIPVPVTTTGTASTGAIQVFVPYLRLTLKTVNKVKIVIYRWSVQTQAYNQVTSITSPLLNDTTNNNDNIIYSDVLPDSSVVGNNLLYTTGGVVPDCNAPATDIMTIFDTRLWVLSSEDPNTFYISKTVVPGTPVEMSLLFTVYVSPNIGTTESTGPVTACGPMDSNIIIFKKNSVFYINGTGPDNLGTTASGCSLGSYSQPTFITSIVGCANQNSVVLIPTGLMFQSDKGIWVITRDLSTQYVGSPVEKFNDRIVTSAKVIPGTNYVLFTLDTNETLMYDYYYQKWGYFVGIPALSSCIYKNKHTVLTQFGEIWQETPGTYLDGSTPVLLSFETSWINLAGLVGYQRFYEFYILAKYLSPHLIYIGISYDYNDTILHQEVISPKNFSPATPGPFGEITPFGSPGNVETWRIHAKKQLCKSFKLTISEVFNPLYDTVPGAGFTMSGINCKVDLKKARYPIPASTTAG